MNRNIPIDRLVDSVMAELEKKLFGLRPDDARPDNVTGQHFNSHTREPGQWGERKSEPASDQDPTDIFGPVASKVPNPNWAEGMDELLQSTPGRIGVWRTGTRPLTKEMLKFRCDHAAAVDSIYGEVNQQLLERFNLFTVETHFENTENYLKRPDMGRIITDEGVEKLRRSCRMHPQVQIVISDGLSANAIDANLEDVYPSLLDSLSAYGLSPGTPFFVRGGRVAVMDHVGDILQPEALVLLIGERPGLVSSKSMSAYMCYRPRKGTVESDRTVISNIHQGGTPPLEAGAHIGSIVKSMLEQKTSGVNLDI
jgi:ethanolamine ammonia-lyase small subunit